MIGIAWALAAGLFWGLAFVAPLMLPGYGAIEITAGRYAAYGLFSLAALAVVRAMSAVPIAGLSEWRIWGAALALTLVGNFIYFVAVTAGIQKSDPAIAALIVGILPVLLPVAANWSERTHPFRLLVLPSLMMGAGLIAVHGSAHGFTLAVEKPGYWLGIALSVSALLAWTIYGVANARAIKARADVTASTWSSLQGVALLPIALPLAIFVIANGPQEPTRVSLATFLSVSLLLGIATSWLAMWCWNKASARLPSALVGQLIVFETLAALAYAHAWTSRWPPLLVVVGAALLIGGVVLGMRRLGRSNS